MKKLKDIVLKKGDIVYFADGHNVVIDTDCFDPKTLPRLVTHVEYKPSFGIVVKVERPTQYETIYEAPKEILTKKEKEYLETVIRPFKNQIEYISKREAGLGQEYLKIDYDNGIVDASWTFPYFMGGSIYKRMELNREYSLEELDLFVRGE